MVEVPSQGDGATNATFDAGVARETWTDFIHVPDSTTPNKAVSKSPPLSERSDLTPQQQELAIRGIVVPGIRKETNAIIVTGNGEMVSTEVIPIAIWGQDGSRHTMRVPTDTTLMHTNGEKGWKI